MGTRQDPQLFAFDIIIEANGARLVRIALGILVSGNFFQARIWQSVSTLTSPILNTSDNLTKERKKISRLLATKLLKNAIEFFRVFVVVAVHYHKYDHG